MRVLSVRVMTLIKLELTFSLIFRSQGGEADRDTCQGSLKAKSMHSFT